MDKTILDIILRAKDQASSVIEKSTKTVAGSAAQADKTAKSLQKLSLITAGVFVGGMALAVKGAADLQTQMIRLSTSAGETQKNLALDTQGVLDISTATATSTDQLSKGLYTINSAGFHGAQGLLILKAAAEGAKSENADLGTVTNAVTTILNDYHIGADKSVSVTNQMVAAVSAGKMNMQDFAGSLSAVLPLANAMHLSFAQVAGAEATMTAQGMSAQQSSQDLANTIRALSNPNQVAINEMQQMGLDSNAVSKGLGKNGLTGTLTTLTTAITQHMGPAGLVVMNAFNQSKSAAQDAETMLSKMPASIQGVAKAYLAGSTSQAAWKLQLQMMTPLQANLAKQFATTADKAHGFNSLLKNGSPEAQTYTAALSKMTGGATGLNTTLMLSGANATTFQNNVNSVADASKKTGSHINGWSLIQNGFNFQMKQAGLALSNAGKSIGTALLPPLTALMKSITGLLVPITDWISKNKTLTAIIAAVITGVAVFVAITLTMHSVFKKVRDAMLLYRSAIIAIRDAHLLAGLAAKAQAAGMLIMKGVMAAVSVATKAWAAVQWVLNAALDGNPIGILILLVAGLIAIVVAVVTHWKQVASFFSTLWNDITGFFRKNILKILEVVGGPLVGLVIFVVTHWKQVSAFFAQLWADIVGGVVGFAKGFVGFFVGLWNNIVNGISGFVGTVVKFFTQLPGNILHAIGNMGNLLFDSGKNIIQGLINGITNIGSNIGKTINNIVSGAVNGFKALLGIHSPSTVFAEAGKNIGQGLAIGINATKGLVHGAASDLANTTNGAFKGSVKPLSASTSPTSSTGPVAASSAPAGNSNVNITVNIGMYAGSQTEKQKVATELWQALMQVAKSHNLAGNVPNFGVRSI